MFRRLSSTGAALAALTLAAAVLVPAGAAGAAKGHRVTILQFNAAEDTPTCPNPATTDCLATLGGSNGGRDMYAVEEVCRSDYHRFVAAHPGWSVRFHTTSVRTKGAVSGCKEKGDMLASPHRITDAKVYRLSKGFKHDHNTHSFLLVCGLIHAAPRFYGCSTHLVFPRFRLQRTQVHNLVKDTAAYRRFGKVVVAGDFNLPEDPSGGAHATPRLAPVNAAHFVETDKSNTPTHTGKSTQRKYDYIFYFSSVGVSHRAALTGPVSTSDHRVLLGEARI